MSLILAVVLTLAAACYFLLQPASARGTGRIQTLGATTSAPPVSLTDCENQTLTLESTGDCVTSLQDSLVATGVNMTVDGQYGAQTRAAVQAFQSDQGLAVDGVAGPITITRLDFVANSPQAISSPPASTVQAAQPSGTQVGPGVYTCGIFTCTYYFSQSATKTIDQAVGNPGSVATQAAAAYRVCKQFPEEAEAFCAAGIAIGTLLFADTVRNAAENDMCLAVKAIRPGLSGEIITPTGLSANASANCIP